MKVSELKHQLTVAQSEAATTKEELNSCKESLEKLQELLQVQSLEIMLCCSCWVQGKLPKLHCCRMIFLHIIKTYYHSTHFSSLCCSYVCIKIRFILWHVNLFDIHKRTIALISSVLLCVIQCKCTNESHLDISLYIFLHWLIKQNIDF